MCVYVFFPFYVFFIPLLFIVDPVSTSSKRDQVFMKSITIDPVKLEPNTWSASITCPYFKRNLCGVLSRNRQFLADSYIKSCHSLWNRQSCRGCCSETQISQEKPLDIAECFLRPSHLLCCVVSSLFHWYPRFLCLLTRNENTFYLMSHVLARSWTKM